MHRTIRSGVAGIVLRASLSGLVNRVHSASPGLASQQAEAVDGPRAPVSARGYVADDLAELHGFVWAPLPHAGGPAPARAARACGQVHQPQS